MDDTSLLLNGKRFFISYAREDAAVAQKLEAGLKSVGIESFRDTKDLAWGRPVTYGIQSGVEDCVGVIVLISESSLRSEWVPYEVGQAVGAGKIVLPLLVSNVQPPSFLRELHLASSIEEVLEYFDTNTKTRRLHLGDFTGQYLGYTATTAEGTTVIVESIHCFQVGQRLQGYIEGVGTIAKSSKGWKRDVPNEGKYRFSGELVSRVFVLGYNSLIRGSLNTGSLTLMVDDSGRFCSGICAAAGSSLIPVSCQWIRARAFPSTSTTRDQIWDEALQIYNGA